METNWKRPKVIPSETEHIVLENCGTLHLTLGTEDERLIEVRAVIGKNGICGNVLLDSLAKSLSILLQTDYPRYKICEKLKRQFLPDTKGNKIVCGQTGKSCVEEIAERIVKILES